jgi:hypothetical protein
MLSYPLTEAESLLVSKLEVAQASLANCEEDLDFLREQITVSFSSFCFLSRELFLWTARCASLC